MIEPRLYAVSIDAAGTLLHPAAPVAEVYAAAATARGGTRSVAEIARAFAPAMRRARALRQGDPSWRGYWAAVVAEATGCADPELLEQLYQHYAGAPAWRLADGAIACLQRLRGAGLRVAVLSNWDTRLRGLLAALGVSRHLDALVVSGECGLEKPDPRVFMHTCALLGVQAAGLLHVGDDEDDDVRGALAAGCRAQHIAATGGLPALAEQLAP